MSLNWPVVPILSRQTNHLQGKSHPVGEANIGADQNWGPLFMAKQFRK